MFHTKPNSTPSIAAPAAPTIDLTFFPNTPAAHFWTPVIRSDAVRWFVDFEHGVANTWSLERAPVRCVR